MPVENVSATNSPAGAAAASDPTQGLGGDEFFQLLIAQLINQDPLEPTSNQELLNQISSIRDIELSTNLSSSLQSLSGQQRFASAASLIGKYVSSQDAGENGTAVSGIVRSVRFDADGKAVLQLEDGREVALESVGTVMDGARAADALVGRLVSGLDRSNPADPQAIEGIVTGVTTDKSGQVMLELDTGDQMRLADVLDVQNLDGATA